MKTQLENHPIADLFPMWDDGDLADLIADMKERGFDTDIPIILHEGKILDGRNRYRAAIAAGVECEKREYVGSDPLGFVIRHNLRRRHLNTSQRSMIAAAIANMHQGQRTDTEPSAKLPKVSQAEAAKQMKVSTRNVTSAKRVRSQADPEMVKKVENGEMTVNQAAATIPKAPKKEKTDRTSWDADALMRDDKLRGALIRIGKICGKKIQAAIQHGTVGIKRADVMEFAEQTDERMLEIDGLIISKRWTPQKALGFLAHTPDEDTSLAAMGNYCLATKGGYLEVRIGEFIHTCKKVATPDATNPPTVGANDL
jgi:hypothetical protein